MNSSTHDSQALLAQHRHRLESTLHRSANRIVYRPSRLRRYVDRLGHAVLRWLTQGHAPRIQRLHQGEAEVWRVYDPIDHHTHYFTHEIEVSRWLEQRYYR